MVTHLIKRTPHRAVFIPKRATPCAPPIGLVPPGPVGTLSPAHTPPAQSSVRATGKLDLRIRQLELGNPAVSLREQFLADLRSNLEGLRNEPHVTALAFVLGLAVGLFPFLAMLAVTFK